MGYEQSVSSRKRLIGLFLAVIFHGILIYGLVTGMARDFIKKAQKTLDVSIVEEVKLPPPPPPPPPPKAQPKEQPLPQPKAYVPPVEVPVNAPATETIASVSNAAPTPPVAAPVAEAPEPKPAPPPPPKPKVRVNPSLMAGCRPPVYPAESLEEEEEGVVVFSFLVDTSGKVVESKLAKTSGFKRLDEAAKLAFESCKFNPGTVNGEPEKAWVQQSFEWKIK